MKIVIIEDEKELGMLMRNFLIKQLDPTNISKIEWVTSLTDGLSFIEEHLPDWIFLDNNLPDGKGIDKIESIKMLNAQNPNARIVMMSAMSHLKEEAFNKGVHFFLDKPISFGEIKDIMKPIHNNLA